MKELNRLIVILLFIAGWLLQVSCANQSPPTGGPKDETPPVLIGIYPEDGTLDFTDNKIELLFDEKVDGSGISKELIISPNIKAEYRIKTQRNTVILQFEEDLPDSTTFSIDFRESITDVTEKNPSEPIKVAFSTGPYIDTLSITGSINDIFTGKPLIDILIGIYDSSDTLTIEEDEPIYFTRSDSSGVFTLSNIRVGSYTIYSLSEKDNSLTYNKSDELVGFIDDVVSLKDSAITITPLSLIKYNEKEFEVVKNNTRRQYVELVYSKSIMDYTIVFSDTSLNTQILHSSKDNIITFYDLGKNTQDSIQINYTVTDSLNTTINDNLNIKFNETESLAQTEEFTTQLLPNQASFIKDSIYKVEMIFNKPIVEFYTDSILLIRSKKDTIPLNESFKFNHNKTRVTLGELKAQDSLELIIKKGTFLSVENDSSKGFNKKFQIKDPEKHGIVRVGIESNETPFIVQLVDTDFNIEQTKANQDSVEFQYVTPGNKFIRLIVDKNNNGRWDKGSFKKRIKPENIITLQDTIKVKENWEIGGYKLIIPNINN